MAEHYNCYVFVHKRDISLISSELKAAVWFVLEKKIL